MTAADFDLKRNYLKKYVLQYATTTDERLGYALDDVFYGLKESHLTTFRRMMDELTLEDVNAAIRKHWQFGNMRIAISAFLSAPPAPRKINATGTPSGEYCLMAWD